MNVSWKKHTLSAIWDKTTIDPFMYSLCGSGWRGYWKETVVPELF